MKKGKQQNIHKYQLRESSWGYVFSLKYLSIQLACLFLTFEKSNQFQTWFGQPSEHYINFQENTIFYSASQTSKSIMHLFSDNSLHNLLHRCNVYIICKPTLWSIFYTSIINLILFQRSTSDQCSVSITHTVSLELMTFK